MLSVFTVVFRLFLLFPFFWGPRDVFRYPSVPLHLWFQASDAHWDGTMFIERIVMLNLLAHLVADWIMEAQRDKPSLETYLYGWNNV